MIARIGLLILFSFSLIPVSALRAAEISPKFQVQKFASCEQMEEKMIQIMKRYQSHYWYPYPLYARDIAMPMVSDAIMEKSAVVSPLAALA